MASGSTRMNESDDDLRLVRRAAAGDAAAAGEALVRHRDRLRRMVEARLDRRVRGRVDPSDVPLCSRSVFFLLPVVLKDPCLAAHAISP